MTAMSAWSLKEPYAPFLSVASVFASAIVPRRRSSRPVRTNSAQQAGLLRRRSRSRATSAARKVVLVNNPDYWDKGADGQPLPYLDKVELRYVPESNARVLGLQNGDYDVVGIVPFNQAKAISETPGLKLEARPSSGSTMSISTTPRSRSTTSTSASP